jgi:hypothetical protein
MRLLGRPDDVSVIDQASSRNRARPPSKDPNQMPPSRDARIARG